MGGKTSTTTQSVQIPPEVLARYNAVNARAEQVAQQPFQQYPGQFVASLTPVQQQGIQQASQAATLAQPYYGLGTAYTMAGGQSVGPLTRGQIGYYESPYTEAVAAPTYAALRQQQGQELAQQQANAIRSGAAFGERSGLERANLMRQQTLGTAQALAPIYQQGYGQAVQTAAGQQGVIAQDLQRQLAAGQQIAGLGTGAQQAALQGAQAALQAGTAEQQTQQADLTARYQQFLQERGYPFQVAQFLANIAMGTGALSGSTTTTTQPQPFFSDRRLKHDVKQIGKTNDGLPIYAFKYNGSEQTQIGLMAQDVEKKKPEAVGLAAGFKTVDYEKATEDSGRKRRDLGGEVMADDGSSMGGAVSLADAGEGFYRGGYAVGGGGGLLGDTDLQNILAMQKQFLGPYAEGGLYGGKSGGSPMGGKSYVPQGNLPVAKLVTAGSAPAQRKSVVQETLGTLGEVGKGGEALSGAYEMGRRGLLGKAAVKKDGEVVEPERAGLLGSGDKYDPAKGFLGYFRSSSAGAYRGGVIRDHLAEGGEPDSDPTTGEDVVNPGGTLGNVLETQEKQKRSQPKLATPGQPGQAPPGLGAQALQAAGMIGGALKGAEAIGSGASWLATKVPLMMAGIPLPFMHGGVVGRHHFQQGGSETEPAPGETSDRPIRAEGITGALSKVLPSQVEKRDGKYVEDLDVKRTVIPLLTGLGAMASSPSRYLGSAILQGLGAGAQSYANLEKQIADVKRSEIETLAKQADIVKGSLVELPSGRAFVRYVMPNGEFGMMELMDYLDNPKGVQLDPASEKRLLEIQRRPKTEAKPAPTLVQQQPTPIAGQPIAPGGPSAPGEQPRTSVPVTREQPAEGDRRAEAQPPAPAITLPPELAQQAVATSRALYGRGTAAVQSQPDVFTPAASAAEAAQNQRPQLSSLATNLAAGPRADSPLVSGKAQELVQPLAAIGNNIAAIFGLPPPVSGEALASAETVKKSLTQFASELSKSGNQSAYAAFQEMINAIPNNLNSPEAQAKMLADIYAINQRMIDRGDFFSQWRTAAEGPNKRFILEASRTGRDADAAFNEIYQKRYPEEKKALIRMFNEGPKDMLNEQGRQMSWFEFMSKYGNQLSQEQKNKIATSLGAPNIMRYFGLGK
jgi:hypothetical protein